MDKYVWVEQECSKRLPENGTYVDIILPDKRKFYNTYFEEPKNGNVGFFYDDNNTFPAYMVEFWLERKPIEEVIKERMPTEEYWKKRCELAEKFILESPCDPDIHEDQIKAYNEWTDFKGDKLLKQD